MAATAFNPISWSPSENITDEKMQQYADNLQWVYDNTPRALYTNPSGLKKPTGVRIVAGKALITARNAQTASVRVQFGNAFSNGCFPIITTGINNTFQDRVFSRFQGIGQVQPNHTGFQLFIEIPSYTKTKEIIKNNFYVHWTAIGY